MSLGVYPEVVIKRGMTLLRIGIMLMVSYKKWYGLYGQGRAEQEH